MKKIITILFSLILLMSWILSLSEVSSQQVRVDGLQLISPTNCPPGGCAPGQRLNLIAEFTVQPKNTIKTNTVVCFTAPLDGQAGTGSNPWDDYSTGWISSVGLNSSQPYVNTDVDGVCSINLVPSEHLITSVNATLLTPITDKLEMALRINKTTDLPGDIKAYVYELQANGITWSLSKVLTLNLLVSQSTLPVYVAELPSGCGSFSPCYINSGDDLPGGLGTGLKDAIDAFSASTQINVIGSYKVKGQTITINAPHKLSGSVDSSISYEGNICSNPILEIMSGATVDHLLISDGSCTNISRNLIVVDSNQDVKIESNTLNNGYEAIGVKPNSGNVLIQFNQITDNVSYAIKRTSASGSGTLNIIANNLFNNRFGYEVDCQGNGVVDHNYWGPDIPASSAAINCSLTPGKQLGAPIKASSTGVDGILISINPTKTSYFDKQLSVYHTSGIDYNLYIVNHGNNIQQSIPFLNSGSEPMTPCSNFYDIFLAQGILPSDLVLSIKYDLGSSCVSTIESSNYCNQTNSALFPIWWFDPANNVTEGWDMTGDSPKGTGASGAIGQVTTCDLTAKELTVTIDSTGRPNFPNDLNFTPFVVGIPLPLGVQLNSFTGNFAVSRVDLKWITSSENNVSGFHLMRSESPTGTYTRITDKITAIGNAFVGGIYNYSDFDIVFTKSYYYKLEVIDNNGNTIEIHGPLNVLTATATPTATATRTITPTFTKTLYKSNTPYVYISPTRFIPSITPTKRIVTSIYKSPTPFITSGTRTSGTPFGPSVETQLSLTGLPTSQTTQDSLPIIATPILTPNELTGTPGLSTSEVSPTSTLSVGTQIEGTGIFNSTQLNDSSRYEKVSWITIMIGAFFGLIILVLIGWLLFRSRIS
jgi:hypothetical protein